MPYYLTKSQFLILGFEYGKINIMSIFNEIFTGPKPFLGPID